MAQPHGVRLRSEPAPDPTGRRAIGPISGIFPGVSQRYWRIADEEEDLETHYNLGIAYREMGLLDEAIGEFQKVAKAVQKGKPFATR